MFIVDMQDGAIVLNKVNSHWSENLVPSPNKKDLIFQHVKGPGVHLYVQQPNGGKRYVCSPEAKCKSNQRHFMKNTTTTLYKHFLQQYPLRRGKYYSCKTYTSFKLVCKCCCACELCRNSDLLSVQKIEALLRLQAITFVSKLFYLPHRSPL